MNPLAQAGSHIVGLGNAGTSIGSLLKLEKRGRKSILLSAINELFSTDYDRTVESPSAIRRGKVLLLVFMLYQRSSEKYVSA
jgi:hypothetical protein